MDTLFVGLRVVVSLGAVLAVIWYAHRRITAGAGKTKSERPITIVGRQAVGQKSSVVIVEAEGKRFLLGVTDHTVTVLSESEARIAHIPNEAHGSHDMRTAAEEHGPDAVSGRSFARHLAAASTPASPPDLPASHGLLRGSILSAETWKLSFAALRQGPRT